VIARPEAGHGHARPRREDGGSSDSRQAARVGRTVRRSLFAPLPTVDGGWPCIVADPPWSFRDKGSRIAPDQRRKRWGRKGYRTVALERLLGLDVRSIAAPDAFLFLWTTGVHLHNGNAAELARAWGFDPTGAELAWVKMRPPKVDLRERLRHLYHHLIFNDSEHVADATRGLRKAINAALRATKGAFPGGRLQIGFGHYTRAAHERVLICRRGRAQFLRHDIPSVFFAPRGQHSAKPDEARRIIESAVAGPRLELFAREARPGWTAWGDQVERRAA
jgi:N6-adenosine-specific RNA methylase IME4